MKRQPIRVGDQFTSKSGTVWLVTEDMKFGRGYWVVNIPERTRQTIYKRNVLETMTKEPYAHD